MNSVEDRQTQILAAVTGMVQEVLGEEWVQEAPITMETTFSYDLEVESIELVALAEKLQDRYGTAIDFPGWLSQMELEDIINLSVGKLVEYIDTCL